LTFKLKILSRLFSRSFVAWGDLENAGPAHSPLQGARLSRHDDHSLEIKAWVEPGNADYQTELDVFIFIPNSFQVCRWSKLELSQDFRSRVRLALPARGEESEGTVRASQEVLAQARRLLSHVGSLSEPGVLEQTSEDYKQVGGIVSELLKHRASAHRRRFVMAHSLSIPVEQRSRELQRLLIEVDQTVELLKSLRRQFGELATLCDPILPLLDEYVSNFYVQYLGKLRTAMGQVDPVAREKADSVEYHAVWQQFTDRLGNLQRDEAQYRHKFTHRVEHAQSPVDQEQAVIRLSQLKKFFQSRMFVDVSLHSPSHRFLETTAIAGTALAGFAWAGLQFFSRPEIAQTANHGVFVFSFAVITYVLRDRIKDRAKVSLHRRVQKWLPDIDQQLEAGGRVIGSIREWFQLQTRHALPDSVKEMRLRASRAEIDRNLPEDVLHIRKVITVHPQAAREAGWALQENTRINVERYLKLMDDPIKELAVLDTTGELTRLQSRRVYHFHVGIELRSQLLSSPQAERRATQQLYRVILDKDGIDRLERVN
jgi:hypothetical protein